MHSDWRPKAFPGLCVLCWSLASFLGAQKNGGRFFECLGTSLLNANLGLTDNVFVAAFEV